MNMTLWVRGSPVTQGLPRGPGIRIPYARGDTLHQVAAGRDPTEKRRPGYVPWMHGWSPPIRYDPNSRSSPDPYEARHGPERQGRHPPGQRGRSGPGSPRNKKGRSEYWREDLPLSENCQLVATAAAIWRFRGEVFYPSSMWRDSFFSFGTPSRDDVRSRQED